MNIPRNPHQKAWVASFFDENHLNHMTSPDMVASPAQMEFMVHLAPDEKYYPCRKQIYDEIMARVNSPIVGEMYSRAWARTYALIQKKIEDQEFKAYLTDLLNIKYQHETSNFNVLPSRVEKRLYKLFMVTTQIEDPMTEEKREANRNASALYFSDAFTNAVNRPPGPHTPAACFGAENIESYRRHLDATKLRRLMQAAVMPHAPDSGPAPQMETEWTALFEKEVTGDGWTKLEDFILTPRRDLLGYWTPRRILYLADRAGEFIFDLAVAKFLVRLGHVVIMAVKTAAIYDLVYMGDVVNDPVIRELIEGVEIISNSSMSKNELAARLRNHKHLKIIADGTMEDLNLQLVSVTFSRVFKEVDGIISKGEIQKASLFETPFEYTQDIYNLTSGPDGSLHLVFKPRCQEAVHFSTSQLEDMARKVIEEMKTARDNGMTVMFYSGIVGSIPGEIDTAIEVMTTFVDYLLKQQDDTYVINPSKYFEPGMDADDLMYMWEIVQRSGLINIWRFQTYQDIEKSFELLGRKVPPQWVGKDSTYSTGCTKERAIAAEVLRENPEMQLIGPDEEKFSRRTDYGIGLFHDTRLTQIYSY